MNITQVLNDFSEIKRLPRLDIDLACDATNDNDPFYFHIVNEFYRDVTRRHPKFPLIRFMKYGVAVLQLPENHEAYLKILESSGRRNIKKAIRNGYSFQRIDYNDHLDEISEILRSTSVRQGPMEQAILNQDLTPINDPPSKTQTHDYPYFGVMKDGKLLAYAGCMVAGDMLLLSTVFGHDAYKSDGLVPLLISGIAEYKYAHYPNVKYYVYDKYYGASPSLRRFKKKFGFDPHVVNWKL